MYKSITGKRVLFYLGHPAHFHLFKVNIARLQEQGAICTIVIKEKDVLESLLKDSGYEFIKLSGNRGLGRWSHLLSVLKRFLVLFKIVFRRRPHLLAGSSAELTVLGRFFGIPSFVFFEDDFEAVPEFAKIAGPLATKLICPEICSAWKWEHKAVKYKGLHELAYLHSDHFQPDRSRVVKLFGDQDKFFLLRFAKLQAYHDVGRKGINTDLAEKLVAMLEQHGKVWITAERELEPQFEYYRISIPAEDIHHALHFASIYIGDSQTMAIEAGVLGTPSVRYNDFVGELSCLNQLEDDFKLAIGITTGNESKLLDTLQSLVSEKNIDNIWSERRNRLFHETIDVVGFYHELILNEIGEEKATR